MCYWFRLKITIGLGLIYKLIPMEFKVSVDAKEFSIFSSDGSRFLVCNETHMYILFKEKKWCCAEPIAGRLLDALGKAIDKKNKL